MYSAEKHSKKCQPGFITGMAILKLLQRDRKIKYTIMLMLLSLAATVFSLREKF